VKDYDIIIDRQTANEENHLCISEALKLVPSHTISLDIGCNSGWLMEEMTKKGCICYGVDNSKKVIKIARNKGLNVIFSDAQNIPLESSYFDIITMVSVLQQCTKDEICLILGECWRLLKDPGWIIGINPMPNGGWGYSAIGKSPYVKSVIEPNLFCSDFHPEGHTYWKQISKDNYVFKIHTRFIKELIDAIQK